MRVAVGSGAVAVITAVLAASAAAEPISLQSVRFTGALNQVGDIAPAGDVNGDGHDDVIVGVRAERSRRQRGVVASVVFGPFPPGATIDVDRLGDRGIVMRGSSEQPVSVSQAGDVNGDGLGDVLVGADYYAAPGRAWVVFGRRGAGTVELGKLRADGITLIGRRYEGVQQDSFGAGVAAVGDVDRDGLDDVGVLASGDSVLDGFVDKHAGSAYVVFGRRSGGAIRMGKLRHRGFRMGFAPDGMFFMGSAGDWNADGHPDIALNSLGSRTGRIWIVYGRRYRRTVNLWRLGRRGVTIRGARAIGATAPWAMASGEDVDGDKRPDTVIGTPVAHKGPTQVARGGGAWVVRGSRSHRSIDLDRQDPRAWEIARGDPAQPTTGTSWAGGAVALARIDGDRLADVILTAGSRIAVVFGSQSHTTRQLAALAPSQGFLIDLPVWNSRITVAGDMNADGHADLLVSTPWPSGPDAHLVFSP